MTPHRIPALMYSHIYMLGPAKSDVNGTCQLPCMLENSSNALLNLPRMATSFKLSVKKKIH